MYESLALLAAFVVLYSTIAGGVERTWISGPIVFTAFGLLIGLPLTMLFLFLALAEGGEIEGGTWHLAVGLVGGQIGIGLAVGLVLTRLVVELTEFAGKPPWLTPTWTEIPVVALACAFFATAQFLGGSGFIAAFTGGLLFGGLERRHRETFLRAAEGTGDPSRCSLGSFSVRRSSVRRSEISVGEFLSMRC